ncbi:DUF397 domain-containing protein [Streptomyces sp. WMMC897]|uniref:DUF397 domain-containing protein n=1 Tax=Streptomyces sp. WMMC897 TaxID=3014782 RepID=UPI0022B61A91|nr:DUF397 domain-containing protein [Streptomyces sp. WMMC897]MCZ7416906.1 DUF397 domain-containing protein [Streptomyces sp. WMMC897]
MNQHELASAQWTKSSYSGGNGGNCVETALGTHDSVPVRDSKTANGPVLVFPRAAWAAFVDSASPGTLR